MIRPHRTTPHLFKNWEKIVRQIRGTKRIVIFLDFDGTLVRIAPLPDAVSLQKETRDVLRKLGKHPKVELIIVSGRRRADLQRFIGIRNIKYLGLYGWENKNNKKLRIPERLALKQTLMALLAELPAYPGAWIEPKNNSFSVHFKGLNVETKRELQQAVKKRVALRSETLQAMTNLRDVEVAPISIGNKGIAVQKILRKPAKRGALAIYFGDDLSDEPGFAASENGVSVLVGRRRATRAQFFLRGPAEVTAALRRMEETIRETRNCRLLLRSLNARR
jgi:trehalose-phosphatase